MTKDSSESANEVLGLPRDEMFSYVFAFDTAIGDIANLIVRMK